MIQNNSHLWDGYKEAGWLNFDKIKDFDESVRYYQDAMNKKDVDLTQVGHALAHALEKSGRVDDSIRMWEQVIKDHEAAAADPKVLEENKGRIQMGLSSAKKNLEIMKIRRAARPGDTKVPVDAQFQVTVKRVRPKVIEVTGRMNLLGAKNFDEKIWGPVGRRARGHPSSGSGLSDAHAREFTFEVDPDLTIMQESVSVRGGKDIRRGGLFVVGSNVSQVADDQGMYSIEARDMPAGLGVPLRRALAQDVPMSAPAKRALVEIALPKEARERARNVAAMNALFEQLRRDPAKIADLDKQGIHVALKDYYSLGQFKKRLT
jgi:tetratricopeptide (TPR) repeat protein